MVEYNQSSYYNNGYKFNGKELDEATGMYYYGARYYDPRISIFISVDLLAEQMMEPYLYTGNNPIMFTDLTGMSKDGWGEKNETWKLQTVLTDFLNNPDEIDINLNKLYDLYCGKYQENGKRKYEFKFLGNLGLNYFFWTEECYLRSNYGERWDVEYEKIKTELKFYHQQPKGFALEILSAIDNQEIEIFDNGEYKISERLKLKLETDNIYKLKCFK